MGTYREELIVDNFAGGGGASCGIEIATGRTVDIAINHDPDAIKMHKANHPNTKHYCESVWEVDPRKITENKSVALAWFSPDCKHFSKAKNGKPLNKNIRGLAWVAVKWASTVKPRVIILENVAEFKTWCPLVDGKPKEGQVGKTFNSFVNALKRQGYTVDWRELRASDYGSPTIRKRFFLIARRDGKPIVWVKPTHANPNSIEVKEGLKKPWKLAKDIIDWSLEGKSIFEKRSHPISSNTFKRIANGIMKYIVDNDEPYILDDKIPILIQVGYGDPDGKRILDLFKPLGTITAGGNKFGLVTVTLEKGDIPKENIKAFLIKYYGKGVGQSIYEPLHTITTKDKFGLVEVKSENHIIKDITLRMLQPRELFNAQGFPEDYIIDKDYEGKKYSKTKQVARCGNSVPPNLASVLVKTNLPELCGNDIKEAI